MQILTFYERQKIEYHLKLKLTQRDIAKRLKRNQSDICREISRNKDKDGKYKAAIAQKKAEFKSHKTNKRKLETNEALHDYVELKLKKGWSPQLIAGKLKYQPPKELTLVTLSHEQIYDYIYNGEGRYEGWYHHLLRKRPKRQPRQGRKKQAKTMIKERVSIHLRPNEINQRTRIGDWESDLAWFKKQKQSISVQYERKTMLTKIHRVLNRTNEENEQALSQTVESFPAEVFKSITFDNGSENACHTKIRDGYDIQTFFCDVYSAWQKGGVENTIGLIRRYLPKGTDMSTITDEQIQAVEDWLNNRPRKKLGYLTPNEAFEVALNH
jgi:transposase, IS30 family